MTKINTNLATGCDAIDADIDCNRCVVKVRVVRRSGEPAAISLLVLAAIKQGRSVDILRAAS